MTPTMTTLTLTATPTARMATAMPLMNGHGLGGATRTIDDHGLQRGGIAPIYRCPVGDPCGTDSHGAQGEGDEQAEQEHEASRVLDGQAVDDSEHKRSGSQPVLHFGGGVEHVPSFRSPR